MDSKRVQFLTSGIALHFRIPLFILPLFIIPLFVLPLFTPPVFAQDEAEAYAKRRAALLEKLPERSMAVFKNPPMKVRNSDITYDYRASSNFYYLTGCEEPGAAFVLIPGAGKPFIMFVAPSNPHAAMWTGESGGIQKAIAVHGADTAFALGTLQNRLAGFMKERDKLFFSSSDPDFRKAVSERLKEMEGPGKRIRPLHQLVSMRLIKDAGEIRLLKKAIDITCDAHCEVMKYTEPGRFEYELEAVIEYTFRKNGSVRNGFPSIVGSGPFSTVLHYDKNQRRVEKGDMVCIDIGAEYGYYSADVTRTIPVNGSFTPEQRAIYEIVLKAEKTAAGLVKPGIPHSAVSQQAEKVLREGLTRLGFMTAADKNWQARIWCPHGISHWLGLDTHDAGGYNTNTPLEPGMVFTIEPGIYIRENALDYMMGMDRSVSEEELQAFKEQVRPLIEKYKNIGIRIEDDILVTPEGYENLSASAPKEIADIEALMAKSSYLNQ